MSARRTWKPRPYGLKRKAGSPTIRPTLVYRRCQSVATVVFGSSSRARVPSGISRVYAPPSSPSACVCQPNVRHHQLHGCCTRPSSRFKLHHRRPSSTLLAKEVTGRCLSEDDNEQVLRARGFIKYVLYFSCLPASDAAPFLRRSLTVMWEALPFC